MRRNPWLLSVVCVLFLATRPALSADEPVAPLFDDLGAYDRPVTTDDATARRYFEQGLTLYYGFNHEEAIRSFEQVVASDPGCAMGYWGIALSAGPNINNPMMDEGASKLAFDNAREALARADGASPVEKALIRAVAARYDWPPPEDRKHLDVAYADAMVKAWEAHPDDPDVGALAAESMMDLRPWDLWTATGDPQAGTDNIVAILEAVLRLRPDHPGANHFYIHTVEASPNPERALASADRLRSLVPGAGHLTHMPSHIDIRLGRYGDAIVANQKGIASDLRYVERVGRQPGFYTIYRAHNYHFLAYAAMFDGRRDLAMEAARNMVAEVPVELVRAFPDFLDGFLAAPIHVMVRFGLWDELLKEPMPPEDLTATIAFWHYGRTVALSALGRTEEAGREFAAFKTACANVPESRLIGNNTALTVLAIAEPMAEGELEYRRGNIDHAFELLRKAVRLDDELRYDEPWGWMQPIRHALGALLLEQGRLPEAEAVYRRDLEIHPGNGWSLHGLGECLRRTGRVQEADDVDAQFRKSWERADIVIGASCYCRRG